MANTISIEIIITKFSKEKMLIKINNLILVKRHLRMIRFCKAITLKTILLEIARVTLLTPKKVMILLKMTNKNLILLGTLKIADLIILVAN